MSVVLRSERLQSLSTGLPIAGATITVYASTGGLAVIYSDAAGTTVIGNSEVTSNAEGRYSYYALPGTYRESIARSGYQTANVAVQVTEPDGEGGSTSPRAIVPVVEGLALYYSDASIGELGLVGNGTTDNSDYFDELATAIEAYDATEIHAIRIQLPPGAFYISRQFTITLPSGYEGGLVIEGAGVDATKFIPAPDNADGCIKIIKTNLRQQVTVRGVSFRSRLSQTTDAYRNNGEALWITSTIVPGGAGYGVTSKFGTLIEDINVGGEVPDGTPGSTLTRGLWRDAIRVDYDWWPRVNRVRISGVYNNGWDYAGGNQNIPAILVGSSTSKGDPSTWVSRLQNNINAIRFVHCYDAQVSYILVDGTFYRGVYFDSYDISDSSRGWEGGAVDQFVIAQCCYGIVVRQDHPEEVIQPPDFRVSNGHVNAYADCIQIADMDVVKIQGVTVYAVYDFGSWLARTTWAFLADITAGIRLIRTGSFIISGCAFHEPAYYVNNTEHWAAIKPEGDLVRGAIIGGNNHSHGGVAHNFADVTPEPDYNDFYTQIKVWGNAYGGQLWSVPARRYIDPNNVATITEMQSFNQYLQRVPPLDNAASPQNMSILQLSGSSALAVPYNLAEWRAVGDDSAGNETNYYVMRVDVTDNTDGSEDSKAAFYVQSGGALSQILILDGATGTATLSSDITSAASAPIFDLTRNRSDYSSASDTRLAAFRWGGKDSAGNFENPFTLTVDWLDNTNGAEGGKMTVFALASGVQTIAYSVTKDAFTLNTARLTIASATTYADDMAAGTGGVPVGGVYTRSTGELARRMT